MLQWLLRGRRMDEKLTKAEDKIAKWLEESTPLERRVMFYHLKNLYFPHDSTASRDMKAAIQQELRK